MTSPRKLQLGSVTPVTVPATSPEAVRTCRAVTTSRPRRAGTATEGTTTALPPATPIETWMTLDSGSWAGVRTEPASTRCPPVPPWYAIPVVTPGVQRAARQDGEAVEVPAGDLFDVVWQRAQWHRRRPVDAGAVPDRSGTREAVAVVAPAVRAAEPGAGRSRRGDRRCGRAGDHGSRRNRRNQRASHSFRIFPDLLSVALTGHASGDCRDSTSAW